MKSNKKKLYLNCIKTFVLLVLFVGIATPAFADFQSSMESILDAIKAISVPIAIILLIFAGWQRMLGNNQIFIAALIGTIIVFGAPFIVELISSVF
ncbi:MAG: TrbC/VirB2 family protein [Candidatus Omnitrophica bacterium]|nr:TrbC/VirB2 family protein [Candidatus Omnitrophota bacterium]